MDITRVYEARVLGSTPSLEAPSSAAEPAAGPPKAGCHVRLVMRRLRAAARTMAERSASFHPLRPAARLGRLPER